MYIRALTHLESHNQCGVSSEDGDSFLVESIDEAVAIDIKYLVSYMQTTLFCWRALVHTERAKFMLLNLQSCSYSYLPRAEFLFNLKFTINIPWYSLISIQAHLKLIMTGCVLCEWLFLPILLHACTHISNEFYCMGEL